MSDQYTGDLFEDVSESESAVMRARNIKPGFFTNDVLAELPIEVRYMFIGLWGVADREGRLLDRPKKIQIEVFPADNIDIEEGLRQLAEAGMIRRYEVDNIKIIQVVNFLKHQRPHPSEAPSTLPPECSETAEHSPVEHLGAPRAKPRCSACNDKVRRTQSDVMNPDIMNPDKTLLAHSHSRTSRGAAKKSPGYSEDFERAWKLLPKRIGSNSKLSAWRAWKARIKSGVKPEVMIAGAERYRLYIQQQGKEHTEFVKQGGTFFGPDKHYEESYGRGNLRVVETNGPRSKPLVPE